jgi:predicted Zn finger-like uncharacterized protein
MLLTRCPECDTTFRVTDETLKKASGQVRCGRCASVFNAYSELQDPGAKSREPEGRGHVRKAESPAPPPDPAKPAAGSGTPVRLQTKRLESDSNAGLGTSIAAVVAEAKIAASEARADDEEPQARQAISATEVDRVLTDEQVSPTPYVWLHPEPRPQSRWWPVASALARPRSRTRAGSAA